MSETREIAEAYAHCESVTRAQAANFYYGIRLLEGARRRAMCAAYAFARRVDDIGDGTLPDREKLALLDREELGLAAVEREAQPQGVAGGDPVLVALADAYRRFSIPPGVLGELVEGVRMDVRGESYESFDQLVLYCRHVAGAIGRVCLAIFGLRDGAHVDGAHAQALADDLGVALQLTNILRDVREDAGNGRVYLPAEDLRRFGLIPAGSSERIDQSVAAETLLALTQAPVLDRRMLALMRFEAERGRQWFERGIALTPLLDRRGAACVSAMAGIYRRLLDRIEADPQAALRRRTSLPVREKAWVAVRGMLGGGA